MGSATLQGRLWGAKAKDWTELCEVVSRPANDAVFERIGVGPGTLLLDVGCGSGGVGPGLRRAGATHLTGIEVVPEQAELARAQ